MFIPCSVSPFRTNRVKLPAKVYIQIFFRTVVHDVRYFSSDYFSFRSTQFDKPRIPQHFFEVFVLCTSSCTRIWPYAYICGKKNGSTVASQI